MWVHIGAPKPDFRKGHTPLCNLPDSCLVAAGWRAGGGAAGPPLRDTSERQGRSCGSVPGWQEGVTEANSQPVKQSLSFVSHSASVTQPGQRSPLLTSCGCMVTLFVRAFGDFSVS